MSDMTDEQLIGYCDIHCQTQRALFKHTHINRMLALAGYPENFVKVVPDGFHSVKDEMKELVRLARERMENRTELVLNQGVELPIPNHPLEAKVLFIRKKPTTKPAANEDRHDLIETQKQRPLSTLEMVGCLPQSEDSEEVKHTFTRAEVFQAIRNAEAKHGILS